MSTYLHNSRCSKSRQGLQLLENANKKFTVREYLKEPLTKSELGALYDLLIKKYELKEFTRTKEKAFKENNLYASSLNKTNWIKAVMENPVLLERPILMTKTKAIVGRPPENLLS